MSPNAPVLTAKRKVTALQVVVVVGVPKRKILVLMNRNRWQT